MKSEAPLSHAVGSALSKIGDSVAGAGGTYGGFKARCNLLAQDVAHGRLPLAEFVPELEAGIPRDLDPGRQEKTRKVIARAFQVLKEAIDPQPLREIPEEAMLPARFVLVKGEQDE